MSIEDDLQNMLKHVNLGGPMDPVMMLRAMQLSILRQVKGIVDGQIERLSKEGAKVTHMDLDPFKILGVSQGASWEEIEKAYKQKAAQHHPDRGGDNMEMIKVNAAYEVLKKLREKEG